MGKYKYPYIEDKNLFAAVKIADETLTHGKLFHRAVEWASKKMDVDSKDVEEYLSGRFNFGGSEDESRKEEIHKNIDDIYQSLKQSLSNIYWCEGDGESNHYIYNIEELIEDAMDELIELEQRVNDF